MARMDLPVVVGIDRAGLVGDDGDTHQGVFDISMLRSIPNLILSQHMMPKKLKIFYTRLLSVRNHSVYDIHVEMFTMIK